MISKMSPLLKNITRFNNLKNQLEEILYPNILQAGILNTLRIVQIKPLRT